MKRIAIGLLEHGWLGFDYFLGYHTSQLLTQLVVEVYVSLPLTKKAITIRQSAKKIKTNHLFSLFQPHSSTLRSHIEKFDE